MKRLSLFNNASLEMVQWYLRPDGTKNEDHFSSDRATHYVPDFKVASVEVGLRFAFEVAPRFCYDMNHRQLPFGCHAWLRMIGDVGHPIRLLPKPTKAVPEKVPIMIMSLSESSILQTIEPGTSVSREKWTTTE